MSEARPVHPEPSREVMTWVDTRIPPGSIFRPEVIREMGDAPAFVLEWLDRRIAWQAAHEAWSAAQPIDFDGCALRWRMHGGTWLRGYMPLAVGDRTHDLQSLAHEVLKRNPDAFRSWSRHVYEMLRIRDRAEASIVEAAERVEGAAR